MDSNYQGITSSTNTPPTSFQPHAYGKQIKEQNQALVNAIQSFNDGLNRNEAAAMANADRAGEDLKALGQLSGTLGKFFGEIQKKKIERFRNEAQVLHERGINSQEDLDRAREEQDRQEAELREQSQKLDDIKGAMVKDNQPFAFVDNVSKLNGYHIAELNRLGVKEIANGFSSGLTTYIDEQIQANGDGSREAVRSYVKRYSASYLDKFGDYSNGLVAKYALPIIQKEKQQRLAAIDAKHEQDRSEEIITSATTQLIEDGDLQSFISRVEFTKDKSGKYIGKAGALDLLQTVIQQQAKGRSPIDLDALGEQLGSNGKPFKEHPRFAFLKDLQDDIIEGNFDEDEAKLNNMLKEYELNFYNAALSRDEPFSDAEIQEMQKDFEDDTGMPASKAQFFSDYKTSTKRDMQEDRENLDALRQRRGFLIESDLRGVHPSVYKEYISYVQEDKPLAEVPTNIKQSGEQFINSMANAITGETLGTTDKTVKWGIAKDNLTADYEQEFQDNIRSGLTPRRAHEEARDTIIKKLKYGTGPMDKEVIDQYTSSGGTLTNDERDTKMAIIKGKQYLANPNFNVNKQVIPGTDDEIRALEKYDAGKGEIPRYYYDVVAGNKALTAWDLANAQYFAATGKELGKGPREKAYDAADPALQQVLRFKPTRSRIFRTRQNVDYNETAMTVTGQSGFAEIAAIAKASGAKFPELVAAQWALESDYGRIPSGQNNFFGAKATAGESSTNKTTTEYRNGRLVTTSANFKNYSSKDESVQELVKRWYQDYETYKGVNNAKTVEEAAEMLVAQGYATDPNYAAKLLRIINSFNQ